VGVLRLGGIEKKGCQGEEVGKKAGAMPSGATSSDRKSDHPRKRGGTGKMKEAIAVFRGGLYVIAGPFTGRRPRRGKSQQKGGIASRNNP